MTIVFADLDPTEAGFTRGELTIHAAVEIDESGNTMTAPYTFEGTDLSGATLFADGLIATGTRIEGESMAPLGTPVP